jgi:hypothetical protein
MGKQSRCFFSPLTTEIERDAMRYRWLKNAPKLELRQVAQPWTNLETGEKYWTFHVMAACNTGFNGLPLDELIDQAMKMYPGPHKLIQPRRLDWD